MSLRVLIADDEPPLRDWLRRLLLQIAPDIEIVAEAGDGATALAHVETLRPDAAFLDIRMPALSGLEVATRVKAPTRIVFVTAYDEFAVDAFKRAAVDYLVKPVTAARLAITLDRLRGGSPTIDQAALLGQLLARLDHPEQPQLLRWLRVGNADAMQLLDVNEVDRFEAADKYTSVHCGRREWLIRIPLKELEQQLDADVFWRVHRGTLVRVAAIRAVRRDLMGHLWLDIHDGVTPVAVSRSHASLFRLM